MSIHLHFTGMKIRMDTFKGRVFSFLCLIISSCEVFSQITDSCIDAPGIIQDGQTCTQLIASQPGMCYDTAVNIMCCLTCRNMSTGIQGCEFGDLLPNCNSTLCDQYQDPTLCCGTCNTHSLTSTTKPACSANQFKCQQSGECFSLNRRCDGVPDCQDGSDESINCFEGIICSEGKVACTDRTECIQKEQVCDGIPNCSDFSDENNTMCPANGTTTLSSNNTATKTTASTITVTTPKTMTTMNTATLIKDGTSTLQERTTSSPKTTSKSVATTTIFGTEAVEASTTKPAQTSSVRTSTTTIPMTTKKVNENTRRTPATTQPINVATKYVPNTTRRAIVTTPVTPGNTKRKTQTTKHLLTTTRRTRMTSKRTPVTIPSIPFTTQKPVVTTQRSPCTYLPFRSWMCNSVYRGYFPNVEDDCRSYYVCEWGHLYYCQCPIFTRFSRSSLVCDWATNVSCDTD